MGQNMSDKIDKLKADISNERLSWPRILDLRAGFSLELFNEINVSSDNESMERGIEIVQDIFYKANEIGFNFQRTDPGHGQGHAVRDYVNSLTMVGSLRVNPRHKFVGFVGGVIHDIGCVLVDRYDEKNRAVRHAEAGALFVDSLLEESVSPIEKLLITYSVAAHTHYRASSRIKCRDGEERVVDPYQDVDGDKPILGVWIPRWVDRLDCSGAAFVGRHYLTLTEEHEDFDGHNFFEVSFSKYMRPLFRDRENRNDGQTMGEHLKMFADSQTNESPYGVHDFGAMVVERDAQAGRLNRILETVRTPSPMSDARIIEIRSAWGYFLRENVEPSSSIYSLTEKLDEMFGRLGEDERIAWSNGFLSAMKEYVGWANQKDRGLREIRDKYGASTLKLPGITDDLVKYIAPKESWLSMIE